MGGRNQAPEPAEEPSRAAGGCVLVVLAGVVVAVLFAIDEAVGVLGTVGVGWVALWRSARHRMSDSSATPPPRGVAPSGDVLAGETDEIARVVRDPSGVMCIIHPVREEVTDE